MGLLTVELEFMLKSITDQNGFKHQFFLFRYLCHLFMSRYHVCSKLYTVSSTLTERVCHEQVFIGHAHRFISDETVSLIVVCPCVDHDHVGHRSSSYMACAPHHTTPYHTKQLVGQCLCLSLCDGNYSHAKSINSIFAPPQLASKLVSGAAAASTRCC